MFIEGIECINYLSDQIKLSDNTSSSFWDYYHSDFNFDGKSFTGLKMLGDNHNNTSSIKNRLNTIVDRLFKPLYYKYSSNKKRFKEIDRINYQNSINSNSRNNLSRIRHSLTLDFLLENLGANLSQNSNVCVIGDGYANMSSILIASKTAKKIFLINLNKSLLLDLVTLKNTFPKSEFLNSICLITDKTSLKKSLNDKYKIVAISSMNYNLLQFCPIDLVININSMQEIDKHITKNYFDFMRKISVKRNLYFYCCNRESKVLPDGTIISFSEFPWKDSDQIIIDELCPWQKYYHSAHPPFFHRYEGKVRHRLVKLST